MSKLTLQINTHPDPRDTLGRIAATVAGPRRRALMATLGKTFEGHLHDHFQAKNTQPNKRGWPKQHFWARIRRATSYVGAKETRATITIADPAFAARLHGATIRPRNSRYLAIPLRPQANGIKPSSGLIADLFVIRSKRAGGLYLVRREGPTIRAYYRLVRSVQHPADPTALPPIPDIYARLATAATDFITDEALHRN